MILAIPNPILGGVTTFLFASVAVAGLSVLSKVPFTRRNRFVLGLSLALGMGNLLVSDWSSYFLPETGNRALAGFYESIRIIIETPFLISAITGVIANTILPHESDDIDETERRRREQARMAHDREAHLAPAHGEQEASTPASKLESA